MRMFSAAEIRSATNNFDKKQALNWSGCGDAYKGIIPRGDGTTTVSIKRLSSTFIEGGRDQFSSQVNILSSFKHSRIVPLLGYSYFMDDHHHRELILVHQHHPCGSIADILHNRDKHGGTRLSWLDRLKICVGAAEGLDYLNTARRVIQCNFKTSNIMLNDNLEANVSGLVLLLKQDDHAQTSSYVRTKVRGTPGYFDPAYMRTGKLTCKSDVYSFGVVMLEILCGRGAINLELPMEQQHLVTWAKPWLMTDVENLIRKIICDESVVKEINWDSLQTYVKLVLHCLHHDPNRHPTMSDVVKGFQDALSLQQHYVL